ncbi:MAG: hypothetical protein JSU84_01895, partial [Thiotrichales bacterium]
LWLLELRHVVIYTPECSQAPLQNAVLRALRLAILPARDGLVLCRRCHPALLLQVVSSAKCYWLDRLIGL